MLRNLEEPTKKKSNQFEPPISIRKKTTRNKKNPQFYRFDDYGDIGCIVYYIVYIYKSIYPIVYSVILLLSSIHNTLSTVWSTQFWSCPHTSYKILKH